MGLKCHWAVLKRQNCRSFIAAMSCHNDENLGARISRQINRNQA